MTAPRVLSSVDALFDPATLAELVGRGPVRIVPLGVLGTSGSRFYEVLAGETRDGAEARTGGSDGPATVRFVLKDARLAEDWFAHRTADEEGREAAVLAAPELGPIHGVFASPYRVVAREPGRCALLMDDVADGLLSDAPEPLTPDMEAHVLDALARMHAMFWESRKLARLPWLLDLEGILHVMGPRDHDRSRRHQTAQARTVQADIREGWREALDRLPEPARTAVQRPAAAIAASWTLPETLVHGDPSVSHLALTARGMAALDWALAGRAPCTVDIGRYLAVNAGRLTTSKEDFLATYRVALEGRRGGRFDDRTWASLEEAGLVSGARTFLWATATAVAASRKNADAEWDWWVDRLQRWAATTA